MVKNLASGTKILYFAEIQGWDKTLNIASSKREDIVSVGIQHTSVPLLLLNYFDHQEDFKGDDYLKYSPAPDYLGCVGPITQEIFIKNQWPAEKIFVLGGFRFQELDRSQECLAVPAAKDDRYIIVTLSNSPIETKEMLLLLKEAFSNKDLDFKILLKSHPCCPADKIAKTEHLNMSDNIFVYTNQSLQEIVLQSKAMIVKGSSAVFWALRNNIPVIVPLLYDIIDLSPVSGLSDLPVYVKDSKELYEAVENILNHRSITSEAKSRDFLDSYLEVYQNNKQYYDNITNALAR